MMGEERVFEASEESMEIGNLKLGTETSHQFPSCSREELNYFYYILLFQPIRWRYKIMVTFP